LTLRILPKSAAGLSRPEEPWGFVEEGVYVELWVVYCSSLMEPSEGVVPAVV
jgi:hypothetical protein